MNWNTVKRYWPQYKSTIRERWEALSEADLDETAGERDKLISKLEAHYGYPPEEAKRQLELFIKGHSVKNIMPDDIMPEGMTLPPQHQERQPGIEAKMRPQPDFTYAEHRGSGKLTHKVAFISGGDSGIGRAVAVLFAREGASVVLAYLDEHEDAKVTASLVEDEGGRCLCLAGDLGEERFARHAIAKTLEVFGRLDILVNNAAEQHVQEDLEQITREQLERTFRTNVFAMFYLTSAALPHLHAGASIINSSSVVAFRGSAALIDYAASKGAIIAFTRSLAKSLAEREIRVNAVAPGPIWTPLIPATFPEDRVAEFGRHTPLGRPGQPEEVAPCYLFLASSDSRYMTGQTLHPNGGEIVGA